MNFIPPKADRLKWVRRVSGALVSLAFTLATASPAQAQSNGRSSENASMVSAIVESVVVVGSVLLVEGSANFVVKSVKAVGEGAVITLQSVGGSMAQGSEVSLRVSSDAAKSLGLAVGSTVRTVAEATGWVLYASAVGASNAADRLLAFLPNKAGEALLHHSAISSTK